MIEQMARKLASDVLLLSEIPRRSPESPRWVSIIDGKTAVTLSATAILVAIETGRGPGFASMVFPGLLVYSYYWDIEPLVL